MHAKNSILVVFASLTALLTLSQFAEATARADGVESVPVPAFTPMMEDEKADYFLDSVSDKLVKIHHTDADGTIWIVPQNSWGYEPKARRRDQLTQVMKRYKGLKANDSLISGKLGDGSYVNRKVTVLLEDGRIGAEWVKGYFHISEVGREVDSFGGVSKGDEFCRIVDWNGHPSKEKEYARHVFTNGLVSIGENGLIGAFAEYQAGTRAHRFAKISDLKKCDDLKLPEPEPERAWDGTPKVVSRRETKPDAPSKVSGPGDAAHPLPPGDGSNVGRSAGQAN